MGEEQPLPAYGACLLGSFNLTQYLDCLASDTPTPHPNNEPQWLFNYAQLKRDIPHVVRAMDNVIDRTIYPLKEQADEAKNKRRMGLGLTGVANAAELLGFDYGTPEFLEWFEGILKILRNGTYAASAKLAEEKGAFPLYRPEYLKSNFIRQLPYQIRKNIKKHGIRNSHLTSIAPTGTISLVADNVSGGLEPVFSHYYDRTIQTFEGPKVERVEDYAYKRGVKGKTADSLSVMEHVEVLALATNYVDSAVSKTCNVGDDVTFDEFKDVYYQAWQMGCKGITTFRASGKRFGILQTVEAEAENDGEAQEATTQVGTEEVESSSPEGATACFIDPSTGQKECG